MAGENNIAARHLNDVSLLVFEAATKSEVRRRSQNMNFIANWITRAASPV